MPPKRVSNSLDKARDANASSLVVKGKKAAKPRGRPRKSLGQQAQRAPQVKRQPAKQPQRRTRKVSQMTMRTPPTRFRPPQDVQGSLLEHSAYNQLGPNGMFQTVPFNPGAAKQLLTRIVPRDPGIPIIPGSGISGQAPTFLRTPAQDIPSADVPVRAAAAPNPTVSAVPADAMRQILDYFVGRDEGRRTKVDADVSTEMAAQEAINRLKVAKVNKAQSYNDPSPPRSSFRPVSSASPSVSRSPTRPYYAGPPKWGEIRAHRYPSVSASEPLPESAFSRASSSSERSGPSEMMSEVEPPFWAESSYISSTPSTLQRGGAAQTLRSPDGYPVPAHMLAPPVADERQAVGNWYNSGTTSTLKQNGDWRLQSQYNNLFLGRKEMERRLDYLGNNDPGLVRVAPKYQLGDQLYSEAPSGPFTVNISSQVGRAKVAIADPNSGKVGRSAVTAQSLNEQLTANDDQQIITGSPLVVRSGQPYFDQSVVPVGAVQRAVPVLPNGRYFPVPTRA